MIGDDIADIGSTLILSPHFDDAVLSAWSFLEHGVRTTDVLTVFGGMPASAMTTEPDRTCGFLDSTDAITTRRAEDARALHGVARSASHLELLELQYAQGQSQAEVTTVVSDALTEWVSMARQSDKGTLTIVAPAGAGLQVNAPRALQPLQSGTRKRSRLVPQWLRSLKHRLYVRQKRRAQRAGALAHPDHLLVRDLALERLAAERDVVVYLFEDLPYLWSGGPDEFIAELRRGHVWSVEELVVEIDRERKFMALRQYTSQLSQLDPEGHRLEAPETLPVTERFWKLTPLTHH